MGVFGVVFLFAGKAGLGEFPSAAVAVATETPEVVAGAGEVVPEAGQASFAGTAEAGVVHPEVVEGGEIHAEGAASDVENSAESTATGGDAEHDAEGDDHTLVASAEEHHNEQEGTTGRAQLGAADLESIISLVGKELHMSPGANMSKIAGVLQEITSHITSAHKHADKGKAPRLLKRVMSQRTHDRMVSSLQKLYHDVPRDEISDQLHAVMALMQNLKEDPDASPHKLLEKTADHLGIELTPEMFEDVQKHMGWATKLLNVLTPHLLSHFKGEEL